MKVLMVFRLMLPPHQPVSPCQLSTATQPSDDDPPSPGEGGREGGREGGEGRGGEGRGGREGAGGREGGEGGR